MRHVFALALLVTLAACGGGGGGGGPKPQPPDPPTTVQFTVVVCEGSGSEFCTRLPKVEGARFIVDAAEKATTNSNGFAETRLARGTHRVRIEAEGYQPKELDVTLSSRDHRDVRLDRMAPPVLPLSTQGKIFLRDGQPWRWKGVTAFKLARLHADGQNIQPFLDAYAGYNVLRVFDYVPWPGTGWPSPSPDQTLAFLRYVADRGWYVEIVLLTDDDPGRVEPARRLVEFLQQHRPPNLLLECANEPNTNKSINTSALRSTLEASGFLFSSGDYDDSPKFYGTFGTAHTPRDQEWPRKAHDLLEYYGGGGPHAPTDPAHPVPWVADEPIRPDQAGQPPVMSRADDFRAYFATASILGAGGTFHSATGRFGELPTEDERAMAAAALDGLTRFPADAPLGPYTRIDEQGATLRTYKVGPYTVRIRPTDGVIFP